MSSSPKSRKNDKRRKNNLSETCVICEDKASTHMHYGVSKVCFSCRAFFRRIVRRNNIPQKDFCNRTNGQIGQCVVNTKTRHLCSFCRYQKCSSAGMDPILVMTDEETEDLKAKGKKAKESGMSSNSQPLTKYRERIKRMQEQKSSDVTNSIVLSQDAFDFLDVSAETYLGEVSSSSSNASINATAPTQEIDNEQSSAMDVSALLDSPSSTSAVVPSETLELEEFLADLNDVQDQEGVVLISSEEANEILESMSHLDQ